MREINIKFSQCGMFKYRANKKSIRKGLLQIILATVLCCLLAGCSSENADLSSAIESGFSSFLDSGAGRFLSWLIDGDTWDEDIKVADDDIAADDEDNATNSMAEDSGIKDSITKDDDAMDATGEGVNTLDEGMDEAGGDIDTADEHIFGDELSTEGMIRYGYTRLSDEEKSLYRDMYVIVMGYKQKVRMNTTNADEIDKVFQVMMNDHPEIYYVEGYTIDKYMIMDKTVSLKFTGAYSKQEDELLKCQQMIDKYTDTCLRRMPETKDEYEKVKYVYDYIVSHTNYNLDAKDNQSIISVCAYGQSVCQGYSKTMQYILNKLGIPCILVTGVDDTGEGHSWNIAYVDGKWYGIDVTWGDASYRTNVPEALPGINYDYLCIDDETMNKTHKRTEYIDYPVCDSLDDFYYVKEGTYFTKFDSDEDKARLKALFDDYYERAEDRLCVKCSDYLVYSKMLSYIVEGEKIFELMRAKDGKVSYARLEDSNALLFYL